MLALSATILTLATLIPTFWSVLLAFLGAWQIHLVLLGCGFVAGFIQKVDQDDWLASAKIFIAWGLFFEGGFLLGTLFIPTGYGGMPALGFHVGMMALRISFAIGLALGIIVSARLAGWWKSRKSRKG